MQSEIENTIYTPVKQIPATLSAFQTPSCYITRNNNNNNDNNSSTIRDNTITMKNTNNNDTNITTTVRDSLDMPPPAPTPSCSHTLNSSKNPIASTPYTPAQNLSTGRQHRHPIHYSDSYTRNVNVNNASIQQDHSTQEVIYTNHNYYYNNNNNNEIDGSLHFQNNDHHNIPTSSPSTPFRFSSFPASLPRVNPRSIAPTPSLDNLVHPAPQQQCTTPAPTAPLSFVGSRNTDMYNNNNNDNSMHNNGNYNNDDCINNPSSIFSSSSNNQTNHPFNTSNTMSSSFIPFAQRKRMALHHQKVNDEEEEENPRNLSFEASMIDQRYQQHHGDFDTSRDESHNTSISSISIDQHHHHHQQQQQQQQQHQQQPRIIIEPSTQQKSTFYPPSTDNHGWLSPILNNNYNDRNYLDTCDTNRAVWLLSTEELKLSSSSGANGGNSDHNNDDDDDDDEEMTSPHIPVHAKLFLDDDLQMTTTTDDHNHHHDDDDDGVIHDNDMRKYVVEGGKKAFVRTRLNFNSLMSPSPVQTVNNKNDPTFSGTSGGTQDTTHMSNTLDRTKSSIPPQHHHDTSVHCNNFQLSPFTSISTDGIHSVAPRHPPLPFGSSVKHSNSDHDHHLSSSLNHHEAQFRLQLDSTQCSPIINIPDDIDPNDRNEYATLGKMSPFVPKLELHREDGMEVDDADEERRKLTSSPQKSLAESTLSSNASSKIRKLRPMPDMSAFEDMASSTTVSSLQNQDSFVDHGDLSKGSGRYQNSPMKCPPTPVRTPAWVHYKGPLTRANSLTTSKVLAACTVQIPDGLSSLENSLMEDDKTACNNSYQNHLSYSLGNSFSAVLEEDECEESTTVAGDSILSHAIHDHEGKMSKSRVSSGFSHIQMMNSSFGDYQDDSQFLADTPMKIARTSGPHKNTRNSIGLCEVGDAISFESEFELISQLGSGSFADVFKARCKSDSNLYAIKRNRRQFRGKRDRELALTEVRIMQRLQENTLNSTKVGKDGNQKDSFCLYVLFFIRAWQEGGQLYSQTELCCRDTCRQFMLSLTTNWIVSSKIYPFLKSYSLPLDESASKDNSSEQSIGRLVPEGTIWKIFHDVTAGLSHIHSRGIVHRDIKPDNIFFVLNSRLGAVCKVGDFGVAGDIGAVENGEEGDTMYMPQELLTSPENRPSGDIFSLGLSMYELASSGTFKFPREGSRWHEIRSGNHVLDLPSCRSKSLRNLVQRMIQPDVSKRPTAERILIENEDLSAAGKEPDKFLTDYIKCVTEYDNKREREAAIAQRNANISRQTPTPPMLNRKHPIDTDRWNVRTPTPGSGTSSHSTISKI